MFGCLTVHVSDGPSTAPMVNDAEPVMSRRAQTGDETGATW